MGADKGNLRRQRSCLHLFWVGLVIYGLLVSGLWADRLGAWRLCGLSGWAADWNFLLFFFINNTRLQTYIDTQLAFSHYGRALAPDHGIKAAKSYGAQWSPSDDVNVCVVCPIYRAESETMPVVSLNYYNLLLQCQVLVWRLYKGLPVLHYCVVILLGPPWTLCLALLARL